MQAVAWRTAYRSVLPAAVLDEWDERAAAEAWETAAVALRPVPRGPLGQQPASFCVRNEETARDVELRLEDALDGITVPLHPGAKRFYREAGLPVDQNGVLGKRENTEGGDELRKHE